MRRRRDRNCLLPDVSALKSLRESSIVISSELGNRMSQLS